MKLRCLMVLVDSNQDTQTAHRDFLLHTEELELIPVLPALQRQWILGHIHQRVLPQGRPLLVQLGMGLAQRGITGQTGLDGHTWLLYAVVTVDNWRGCCCRVGLSCCWLLVCGEILDFFLKACVYVQSEIRWEEYLTLWTEERTLSGLICFPNGSDTGEAEVMSTLERHRFCEKILADRTLQRFANSPHGAAFTCYGRLLHPVLLTFQLINVSHVYKPLKSLIVSGY